MLSPPRSLHNEATERLGGKGGAPLRGGPRRRALDRLQRTGTPRLGSDCHNLTSRPPNLKEGRKVIMQKLGEAFLTRMDQNAQRLTSSAVEAS